MAISNIPTFEEGEIVTAGKLNQLGSAVETKFAGAIAGGDLAWPLTAQGNLDMAGFSILSVKRFWNFYNADEYDTVQEAIDAAEATSGGTVVIPPNSTASKFTIDGLTVTSGDIAIIGGGSSSTLSVTSGASAGYFLRTNAALSNFLIGNLTIDGSGNVAAGQTGLYFQQATNVHITNVIFNDLTGDMIRFENDGTAGNQCTDCFVSDCRFLNGDAGHIFMDDIDGCYIDHCRFRNPGTDAIEGVPDGASSLMRSIEIDHCRMSNVTRGVYIVGASATANDNWRLVSVLYNEIFTSSGIGITVGAATAVVKHGKVTGNTLLSTSVDAILVRLEGGSVSNNTVPAAGADALDITLSNDITVRGNIFPDAVGDGIDATDATNCVVVENNVRGFGGEGIVTTAANTGCLFANNYGVPNTSHSAGASLVTAASHTGDTATTPKFEHTIQAGMLVEPGQAIRVTCFGGKSGAGNATISHRLDDVSYATSQPVTTAAGSYWMQTIIYAVTSATQTVQRTSIIDAAVADCNHSTAAVDFTADVVLDVSVALTDGAGTVTLSGVLVEYINVDTDSEI